MADKQIKDMTANEIMDTISAIRSQQNLIDDDPKSISDMTKSELLDYLRRYPHKADLVCQSLEHVANPKASYNGYLGHFEYDPTQFEVLTVKKILSDSFSHRKYVNRDTLVYIGSEEYDSKMLPVGFDKWTGGLMFEKEMNDYISNLTESGLREFIDQNPGKGDWIERAIDDRISVSMKSEKSLNEMSLDELKSVKSRLDEQSYAKTPHKNISKVTKDCESIDSSIDTDRFEGSGYHELIV